MSQVTADRVLETSATTGTTAYILSGAVVGYRAFATIPGILAGDIFDYFAEGVNANGTLTGLWEIGVGTWNSNGTISRNVNASSNSNAIIHWSTGTVRIGLAITATTILNSSIFATKMATSLILMQATLVQSLN